MKLLYYITLFLPLLPILFFILFKIKSKERTVWIIFIYILYYFIHELLSYYLQTINKTYFIFNLFALFTIAEFSFISYYYYLIFEGKKIFRQLIILVVLAFLTFAISNLVFSKTMESWDSFAIGIESLVIIIFSAYYLFSKIKSGQVLKIYTTFHFWISATFLLYFCGTFFLNIMAENLRKNPEYQMIYSILSMVFIILKNILLTVAITKEVNKINPAPEITPNLDEDYFLNRIQ